MLVPIHRQFGAGGSGLTGAGTPPVFAVPEFVHSQQTRWVHPFRLADGSSWAVTVNVLVKPFTITPP